ncbi:sodium/solute symporter [Actinomadura opuntiae]|uniref:sodium/solute symporter n=1 Tax=Actinomadura sp. OS1-43 TaxID=604315 RepID=UPI00255AFA59|nr:cation acetate symporter [Actinomadura sp. OS1-43]MDL4819917.1 cation acetate symporter [Actinomadura sp. OS1-43]
MTAPAVPAALTALAVVLALTAALGLHGRRAARTPADFLVASRGVSPLWNATAIGSEYISAAAYLGTAGLILAYGADMLWLPIGATAGYVLLLAFVAAPLRRSGAYTLSDFAEWRLGSRAVRRAVTCCVCFVGWFYLLPQFQGAGVTLRVLTGAPVWTGWAVIVAVALALVASGGMRGITAVQAVQFWVKLLAVAIPAVALLACWHLHAPGAPTADRPMRFEHATRVHVRTGTAVTVPAAVTVTTTGRVDGARHDAAAVPLPPGRHTLGAGTELVFPRGAAVPRAERLPARQDGTWPAPFGRAAGHGAYTTYSTLLGVLLGTMGLPHILMRFYTNTCGRAARRTAALVPGLLALFYVFPAVHGALGRLYTPELLMTGDIDATILLLPGRAAPGPAGALLTGVVAAGAFAAFISTSCGLVMAIAGTVTQRMRHRDGVTAFRIGVVLALAAPLAALPGIAPHDAADLVTTALCVSACSLCPLLVLGIWWRGLTAAGACAGVVTGGGLAVAAGVTRLASAPRTGWAAALLAQPTLAVAPAAFAAMIAVSLLTRRRAPRRTDRAMARLHLPEHAAAR